MTTMDPIDVRLNNLERTVLLHRAFGACALAGIALAAATGGQGDGVLRTKELVVTTDGGTVRIGSERGSMLLSFADLNGKRIVDLYADQGLGGSLYFRRPDPRIGNLMELSSTKDRCNFVLYKNSGPAISLQTLTTPAGEDGSARVDTSSVDVWNNAKRVVGSLTGSVAEAGWLTLRSSTAMLPFSPQGVRTAEVNGTPTSIEEGSEALRCRISEELASPPSQESVLPKKQ